MLNQAMSKNLELMTRFYEAWNRNDLDAGLEVFHREAEWHTSGVFPDLDPVYRGHEGIARFWRRVHEPWETFRIDMEQFDEQGDYVWTTMRFRAKGADSGVDVDMRFANAIRIQDGLIVEITPRRTAEEAREALEQRHPTARSQRP
jgi:ketosteroid isomerase-like protein